MAVETQPMEVSEQEKKIVLIMREMVAFEVIEIHKDKLGVPDTFLLKRSQRIMVTPEEVRPVKSKVVSMV